MSDFWSKKVGVQQTRAPAPAPPSNRPWWQPAPVASTQQPVVVAPQQVGTVPVQQQASVQPGEDAHFGDLIRQDGYTTEKAQSARDSELCPDCGSPNYMSPKGIPNAMKQCFNCGFNPRFAHSTAGASGIGQKNVAPPKPARSQTLSESNFNPGVIIGRVN